MEDGSCPHEAGLSIAKPFPLTSAPMPNQDVFHILAGAVYLERGPFFLFFHRQGGGFRLARPFLWAIITSPPFG